MTPAPKDAARLDIQELELGHLEAFARLFDAASCACYCRYWHFEGTKNEWLDRCAHRPEENVRELAEALRARDVTARGLVAVDARGGGEIVGWMKLAPRERMAKLTKLPVYRHLPFEQGTWTIGCFVVHPDWRRRGVARALAEAAEGSVRAWGGRFVEAHPRRSSEALHDEEAWQGPERMFEALGYEALHDMWPYPVYRKALLSSGR